MFAPFHEKGQNTTGYSSPLLLWMVTSLTAFSSVSSRSWCSSATWPSDFPLLADPLEQAGDPQAILDADAVEHFREMQQVGQPALAVGKGQQPGPDLLALHEAAEHLDEPFPDPKIEVIAEPLQDLLPLRLLLRQGLDPGAGVAHQVGRQRGQQLRFVRGVGNRRQHALRLQHFPGVEQAGAGVEHARNVALRQRVLDQLGLAVLGHEHGNVLGQQLAVAQGRVAVQQRDDLRGHNRRKLLVGRALVDLGRRSVARTRAGRPAVCWPSTVSGFLSASPLASTGWKRMPGNTKGWAEAPNTVLTDRTRPDSERQFSLRV